LAVTVFPASTLRCGNAVLRTGRLDGQDVILVQGACDVPLQGRPLEVGEQFAYPATYENMLIWERKLAPQARLQALNGAGFRAGFGAGNRIVVAAGEAARLRVPSALGGWEGIFRAMVRSAVPFWFLQQSIVRELIPEGVHAEDHPGMGHTGGYGPREFLRAGLFAYASLGGYTRSALPIGADADHAIVTGHDEQSLNASLALNKLALAEARDYTKFTVDTSHLFGFPARPGEADRERLHSTFAGRTFRVPNILPGQEGFSFAFEPEDVETLAAKYWTACRVHCELYHHIAGLRGSQPFDYELSLDETHSPTPPRELLFYLVTLHEVLGLPAGSVASAGPNLGFVKRESFRGDLQRLRRQVNACASILAHFGAMLSVHSADGAWASEGKGPGVDAILQEATGGQAELKVADVYQELLWDVLASSPHPNERALFLEAWQRCLEAAAALATAYREHLGSLSPQQFPAALQSEPVRAQLAAQLGPRGLQHVLAAAPYGLAVFQLAAALLEEARRAEPNPRSELFRRLMFLVYRPLRPAIFEELCQESWDRLGSEIEHATTMRLQGMGWLAQ